jgi:hypothetical protein
MALSASSRSTLYQTFSPLLGEKATEEMLANFPARDVEEPVTKEHLDRRIAEVQTSIAEFRGVMRTELAHVRRDMSEEFRSQQRWIIGVGVALTGVLGTLVAILH